MQNLPNITIHVLTYNEEVMLQFFIDHYRKLFPNCIIKVYDNHSTDSTVEIAKKNGCVVEYFDTGEQLNDLVYLEIKNHKWKDSETDWVIVCDCDELVFITPEELANEESIGTNIVSFNGYSMVNFEDEVDVEKITLGFRDTPYDKKYVFNKSKIKEILYLAGCHVSDPTPILPNTINYSSKSYVALHYKYLSPKYTISRNQEFAKRMSEYNISNQLGFQYLIPPEHIYSMYNSFLENVIKVI
jgi:glycosyltransferase involved in cell wall biosynthesis